MYASPDGWVGRRLSDYSSSTFCELCGILDAVSFLSQRALSAVIICDSQSALQALSSANPHCTEIVNRIFSLLALTRDRAICVKFIWIPSHINISCSDKADALAKAACALPPPAAGLTLSMSHVLTCIRPDPGPPEGRECYHPALRLLPLPYVQVSPQGSHGDPRFVCPNADHCITASQNLLSLPKKKIVSVMKGYRKEVEKVMLVET